MNRPYQHRQKKPVKPVMTTKLVRIDFRTQIVVSVDIPDEVARANYMERISRPVRGAYERAIPSTPNMPVKEEFKEIAVGDLDDIEELVETDHEVQEQEEE